MTNDISRREFLKRTSFGIGVGAAALEALEAEEAAAQIRPPSANEKINVGLVGCGGMGMGNMGAAVATGMANVVALCDVDAKHLAGAQSRYPSAKGYHDYRDLIANKNVEVVCVSTPDHWHAIPTITACQAGKDVYCEKPLAHNVVESADMVKAARKYNRVVNGGTQQRTDPHFIRAVEIVQSGLLGRITFCRTWNVSNEDGMGTPIIGNPPPGLDYDFWLGPAPKREYNSHRCHFTFRWFYDYAGGMITDWGVHLNDIVLWGMKSGLPKSVSAVGGKYCIPDDRDTPDTQYVSYDMEGGGNNAYPYTLVYEMRKQNGRHTDGADYGIEFYGTNGTLRVDRGGFSLYPEKGRIPAQQSSGNDDKVPHWRNFLTCVKTRRRPASDVEITHISTVTCLLGNVSLRSGRKIWFDPEKMVCTGDQNATELLRRVYRKPYLLPKV